LLKKITVLLTLVLMFALTSTAGAQSDIPAMDPKEVDGLESGYARMYIADIEGLMATPGAMDSLDGLSLSGMAAVFTFEDDGAASDAFGDFADQFAQSFLEGAEVEAKETKIDDLGDKAVQYSGEATVDETTTAPSSMILVQKGEFIYVSFFLGGEDVEGLSRGLAEHMMEGKIGDEEVVVVQEGTSTGGAFEVMPGKDDADVVAGMVPFMDLDFMEGSTEG
jgi:hypothetical protein